MPAPDYCVRTQRKSSAAALRPAEVLNAQQIYRPSDEPASHNGVAPGSGPLRQGACANVGG
jgi:hypothetical protein